MIDWAACLAEAAPGPLAGVLLRLVESQEQIATNQLVGSLDAQALLEEMLETTKPPIRKGAGALHYLLSTPFRYPPLKYGSRFGRRTEPSLFYGSLDTQTVLAEAAYYRFVFWHGMKVAPSTKLDSQHTLFGAAYSTAAGLKLQDPPFSAHEKRLAHPSDYRASQELGSTMRALGVGAFEFVSARAPGRGINVALFHPDGFARPAPISQELWLGELTATRVRFLAAHGRELHEFPLTLFLVAGHLPLPA